MSNYNDLGHLSTRNKFFGRSPVSDEGMELAEEAKLEKESLPRNALFSQRDMKLFSVTKRYGICQISTFSIHIKCFPKWVQFATHLKKIWSVVFVMITRP